MKAKHCEECKYLFYPDPDGCKAKCEKGHKPRFYMPKGNYPHFENDWGWKRRCNDFHLGKHVSVIKIQQENMAKFRQKGWFK